MDPSTANLAGTAVQGGSQFLGSIVDGIFNSIQAKKQREYGKEMAEYSWNKDVEMWNMQNEYNSPQAQMQRYQDAGLNPHLIYGQGTPGNATTQPKYNTPNDEFYKDHHTSIPNMISMYQDIVQRKGEIDRVQKMNSILEEKQEQEMIGTMDKGMEFGMNWGFSPTDRVAWAPMATQHGEYHRPMKLYQMDAAQQQLQYQRGQMQLNAAKTLTEGEQKNVRNWMAQWMEEKLKYWQEKKINIDRDNVTDRLMQEMMDNLPVGASFLRTVLPIIGGAIRR